MMIHGAKSWMEQSRLTLAAIPLWLVQFLPAQQPRFACWPEFFEDLSSANEPQVVDFDGDGLADLLRLGTTSGSAPGVYRGRGDGWFDPLVIPRPPGQSASILAVWSRRHGAGDVDGDGLPDLVLAYRNAPSLLTLTPIYLLRNLGGMQFGYDTTGRLPTVYASTNGVVFADIELDGDLDAYVGNLYGADFLLVNNGVGYFTDESTQRLPIASLLSATGHVAFGDLTGDGLPDIVRAGNGVISFVMANVGDGTFVQGQVLGLGDYNDVDLFDADRDGDLDVYFSGRLASDRLWINHGGGVFVDESASRGVQYRSEFATFADFDDDGDMDGVLATTADQFVEGQMRRIGPVVLQNDGTGNFTNIAGAAVTGNWSLIWGTLTSPSSAAGDFDNDGDIDFVLNFAPIFFGNQKETVTMFNLKRHIRCEPQVARGGVAQVECYADAGHLVAPVLSFAPASASLGDLGRLMIDPYTTLPLPIAFFATQGRIDRAVPIPNDPVFAGLEVYSQALDLWDEAGVTKAHLTNVTKFRIL